MALETVAVPEEVRAAIETFRGSDRGDDERRFLVLSYADKRTLRVVATGPGGVPEAVAACAPKEGNYVVVRVPFQVEIAATVKFAYVDYVPQGTSPMRRALLSTHKGQVEDLLKPYHVSIQASEEADIDEEEIMNRIGASAGTRSMVRSRQYGVRQQEDEERRAAAAAGAGKPPSRAMVPKSVQEERKVDVEDEGALREALADVRDDATETTWCLVSYASPSSLALVASGGGTVSALREAMSDRDRFYYGVFRTSHRVDESDVTRFGFVRVTSDQVSPMQRGRIATHIGFVKALLGQYHVEFVYGSPDELTEEAVEREMRDVLGLSDRLVAGDDSRAVSATYRSASGTSAAASKKSGHQKALATDDAVRFEDEAAFRAAVAAVHSDADPTAWALSRYSGKHTLALAATGQGDADEMMAAVAAGDGGFHVGLVRVTETIDRSETVKFALVRVLDGTVKPMVRGQIATIGGKIEELHAPYHVELVASTADEITHAAVAEKVAKASMRR